MLSGQTKLYGLVATEVNDMNKQNDNRLTSSEVTSLWVQYIRETMAICISKYVVKTTKDPDVASLFKYCLELSTQHLKFVKQILKQEKVPLPTGFTDKDVNPKAQALFTDTFWLHYIHDMTIHGLSGHTLSLSGSGRRDIRNFYVQCINDAMNVYNKSVDALTAKGLYEKDPYFFLSKQSELIDSVEYAMDIIGKTRPLNSMEAGNIYSNLRKSIVAKGLLLGFQQVATDKPVRSFMEKGLKVLNKHIDIFSSILHRENLHTPSLLDKEVTNSKTLPFSNRLLLFHAGFMFNLGMTYYSNAMATSMRLDIIGRCEEAILGDIKVSTMWGNLMIKKGWLEKPPQANDRTEL